MLSLLNWIVFNYYVKESTQWFTMSSYEKAVMKNSFKLMRKKCIELDILLTLVLVILVIFTYLLIFTSI